MLDDFERKIIRRIYGPVKERDQWRCIRINMELLYLFKEPRLSVVIRIARLGWAGRVARTEKFSMPRRLMIVEREGMRKQER
jgi:hypothetical protein